MNIYLKRVTVGFSKFNEGSKFADGPLYYSGSVILEAGSPDFKMLQKSFLEFLGSKGVSKQQIIEFFNKKVSADERYAKDQEVCEPEKCRFFWTKSKIKPIISKYIDGKLIRSNKLKEDELPLYEQALNIFGGDIINLKVKLEYFPAFSQLACWPSAIHIIKDSPKKEIEDNEWNDLLAEEAKDLKMADKPETVKTKAKPIKKKTVVKEQPVVEKVVKQETYTWDDIE